MKTNQIVERVEKMDRSITTLESHIAALVRAPVTPTTQTALQVANRRMEALREERSQLHMAAVYNHFFHKP